MSGFVIAAACNSAEVLEACLGRSPMLAHIGLQAEWGAPSAAAAYNRALDATTAPVVIFAHQDVYFPRGWDQLLATRIREVEAVDPNWALIGAFGVGLDDARLGPVWSSSIGQIIGGVSPQPVAVQSLDEMVIVMRRAAGLRFDEEMGGWHMYGTDIVTQARTRGFGAWAVSLPCIHNDGFKANIGVDYAQSYRKMQRKWAAHLPISSPIIRITRHGLHLYRDLWHARRSAGFRATMAVASNTPVEDLARRCGWMDLSASA